MQTEVSPKPRTKTLITEHAPTTTIDLDTIREQVLTGAAAASSKNATDVAILDVGPLLGITDFFLLVSASNERQLSATVDEVEAKLLEHHGRKPLGREGTAEAGWLVRDFGDFVLHAFTTEQREVYGLERLWSDAPRTPFTDPAIPAEG